MDVPIEVLKRDSQTGRPLLVRLPNGTLGHFQRRDDDCMRAAVATILNCRTLEEVPDPDYDARIAAGESHEAIVEEAAAELTAWLQARGLQMTIHRAPPTSHTR
jgi:hypothetical protein